MADKFHAEISPASSHSVRPLKTGPLKTRELRMTRTPAREARTRPGRTLSGMQPLPSPAKTMPLAPIATEASTSLSSSSA